MFVVSQTAARYLQPARLDDELFVTAELQQAGRALLILAQQARLGAGGPLACEATIRIAWVQADTLKPSRIPAEILQRLSNSKA